MYRILPNSVQGYYDKIILGSADVMTKGKCIRYRHTRFDGKNVAEHERMFIPVNPTVIPSDGTIAGYLPAPKDADALDATIKFASELAERNLQESARIRAQMPSIEEEIGLNDLAAGLFGTNVQVAEPEPEAEPEVTQNVMFTYKSGNVKHELRAGATIVKVGKAYYTQLGRKITAIYTDDTCKRTVPERHYARLFNVSEDPTLFA